MVMEKPTEEAEMDEVLAGYGQLTGENMIEMLELAEVDLNVVNARMLLHHAIILANEVGQPMGQNLMVSQNR
jgi:hypothetical protein